MAFHEVLFPLPLSLESMGTPGWQTEVAQSASGSEQRNQRWSSALHVYDVAQSVRTVADLETLMTFFHERRGRFHGFRFRDPLDNRSCAYGQTPGASDQVIGTGDGTQATFQLRKRYGSAFDPFDRPITKPVSASVRVALGGTEQMSGWSVDLATGIVTFDTPPGNGVEVTAGFEFDVPARFDVDEIRWTARGADVFVAGPITVREIRA